MIMNIIDTIFMLINNDIEINDDNYKAYKLLEHLKTYDLKTIKDRKTFKRIYPNINIYISLNVLNEKLKEYENSKKLTKKI